MIDTAISTNGTITTAAKGDIIFMKGIEIDQRRRCPFKNTYVSFQSPLSRSFMICLAEQNIVPLEEYEEYLGQGIKRLNHYGIVLKLVRLPLSAKPKPTLTENTRLYISAPNEIQRLFYFFRTTIGMGVSETTQTMFRKTLELAILSGDNTGE